MILYITSPQINKPPTGQNTDQDMEENEEDDDVEILDEHNTPDQSQKHSQNKDQSREAKQNNTNEHDEDLSDEDDELPIAPETVYDAPGTEDEDPLEEERNIFSDGEDRLVVETGRDEGRKCDENGNEEVDEDEFEMPGMPAHLTNVSTGSA